MTDNNHKTPDDFIDTPEDETPPSVREEKPVEGDYVVIEVVELLPPHWPTMIRYLYQAISDSGVPKTILFAYSDLLRYLIVREPEEAKKFLREINVK